MSGGFRDFGTGGQPAGKKRRTGGTWAYPAFFGLAIAWAAVASQAGLLQILELRCSDLFFRWRHAVAPPEPPDDIVVVAIDEPSMQEIGIPWPWPRALHADLVDALVASGASVVAFDVLFTEPSEELHDQLLADAIARAGNVVLAEDYSVTDDAGYRQEIWMRPLDRFLDACRGSGLASVARDPDGFVRRSFLETRGIPSLSRAVAEIHAGAASDSDPVATFGLPHDVAEPLVANYLGPPRTIKTVSYYQALDPAELLPDGTFQDKIVLVGTSLSGATDLATTDHFGYPFLEAARQSISGVEIHATLIDTLLRRRYIRPLGTVAHLALLGLFLAAGGLALVKLEHWRGPAVFAVAAGALFGTDFLLFLVGARSTPTVAATSAFVLYFALERIHKIVVVDREKRFIKKAFKYYVSPPVVDRLVADPDLLSLGGEYYDTTVVFTDLVGFTSLAERMEPFELRKFLTGYFTEMVNIFLAHDGTLDKFIGDALMCFFGVPIRTPEHPYQGAMTAWEMQVRLGELNAEWGRQGLPPLSMRIGVNSGRVVAGNMGTDSLFNYTIMGDCVNLGARLESANKQYGTSIMMGQSTWELIGDRVDTRVLDCIRVKGKKVGIRVYELLGPRGTIDASTAARVGLYEEAFEAYQRQEFEAAMRSIDRLLATGPDRPAEILRERCEEYRLEPPGDDWDGIYTMKTK